MSEKHICPSCGSVAITPFYELKNIPVHSVLLLPTKEKALGYPKGNIILGFCQDCGFISNMVFDPTLHEYSAEYDPTQAYSSTFNAFHREMATRLIERYDLHNKEIIEIGCGQGEFLTLLCELADNRGIGFDPAYVDYGTEKTTDRITFIQDFYSEKYGYVQGDFVCCKMTLEHILDTADFVSTVRRSIGDRPNTIVFFQVPNAQYILNDLAWWDIYYEHCSYFTPGALARLFRRCGFDIFNLTTVYNDQYLIIEAKPKSGQKVSMFDLEENLSELARSIGDFSKSCEDQFHAWQRKLEGIKESGQRVVIWGAGSKGVTFLNVLKIQDEIEYAVDVNPRKHGTFMAGTGQEIVCPEFLSTYQPDIVIVMNPIYCDEIQQNLSQMGVEAQLLPV